MNFRKSQKLVTVHGAKLREAEVFQKDLQSSFIVSGWSETCELFFSERFLIPVKGADGNVILISNRSAQL